MNQPKRNARVAWTEIDGEIIAICPDKNVVHHLNSTGSFIWLQLSGEHTMGAIAELLTKNFEIALPQAEEDVAEFLTKMQSQGLVDFGYGE